MANNRAVLGEGADDLEGFERSRKYNERVACKMHY
jgi:hypothetical protein